jgi:energy-coupling factor transporter ATP-binding protein EcfA2
VYIKGFEITDIKNIQSFVFTLKPEEIPGWHVVIGDNGSGKTTLARALALALVGPKEALALKLKMDWGDWIRIGSDKGTILLGIKRDTNLDQVKGQGQPLKKHLVPVALTLTQAQDRDGKTVRIEAEEFEGVDNNRYVWGGGKGWFSASYGPFRRFSGGSAQYEKLYYSNPRLAPHLSIFGEDAALSECWTYPLRGA